MFIKKENYWIEKEGNKTATIHIHNYRYCLTVTKEFVQKTRAEKFTKIFVNESFSTLKYAKIFNEQLKSRNYQKINYQIID